MTNIFKNLKNKIAKPKKIEKKNFIIQTFLDIFLLFKSFLNWNISKLIIFLYSVLIGFVSIIPIIIIFFIYTFFSNIDMSMLIEGMFTGQLLFNLVGNILLVLLVVVYFIIFSYSNILLSRLNNLYIDGSNSTYKNKIYFDFNRLYKYFKLSLLNILILLIPVIIFLVLISLLFLFSGSFIETTNLINSGEFNYFSVFSFIFIILGVLITAYLYYRLVFSFIILSDDKIYTKDKKVIEYIKESFIKTKGIKKLLKFITLLIIFIVLVSPINYVGKVLENNGKYLNDYLGYINLTEEQKLMIPDENVYYYEGLKVEFNGFDSDRINKNIKLNYMYIIFYSIFNFIFLYGLFIMIFSSFYRRELN